MKQKTDQLCWQCLHATGKDGGCSWQHDFTPVSGWSAEPTILKYHGERMNSYEITACPEFIRDTNEACTRYVYVSRTEVGKN